MQFNSNKGDSLLEKIIGLLRPSRIIDELSLGANGHIFVDDDSQINSTFSVIAAWDGATATVDYTVTQKNGTAINHSDVVLQDGGLPIYGVITNLDVTDGAVIAYYHLDYR